MSIPLLDVVAEDADLMVRFGPGHYADVEHIELARDVVTPLASPAFVREHGPFERPEDLEGLPCCAARWSPGAPGFRSAAGLGGAQRGFAVQRHWPDVRRRRCRHGRGPGAPEAGRALADHGTLVRLFPIEAPSPHAHYLCWRTGAMERWECSAFAQWLKATL